MPHNGKYKISKGLEAATARATQRLLNGKAVKIGTTPLLILYGVSHF